MILQDLLLLITPYIKQAAFFLVYFVLEYWLGKTKKTASGSVGELIANLILAVISKLLNKKGKLKMSEEMKEVEAHAPDKEIPLGEIGKIEIDFHKGLASISLSAKLPGGIAESGAFIKMDSEMLLNAVFEAIKKKLPEGSAPLLEGVKGVLVGAVKAID